MRTAALSQTTPSPRERPEPPAQYLARVGAGFRPLHGRYLRRHFHSVRLLANSAPRVCEGLPLAIYLNHSSWWDPLVCLFAARRFFPTRASYGPIDGAALERYRFFRRLGLFGVENGTPAGARQFLETASAILARRTQRALDHARGKVFRFPCPAGAIGARLEPSHRAT